MNSRLSLRSFSIIAAATLSLTSLAHAEPSGGGCSDIQKATLVRSVHSAEIEGKKIPYTATAGFVEVLSNDESAKACVFYVAYTANTPNAEAAIARPITFAFNGGPGSSSIWLHLGLMGPKRVNMGEDGLTPSNSLALIPNTYSLLDVTDIVMIDPVATGFSYSEDTSKADKFFGVRNDYTSIAGFVRNYINSFNRWMSPKFILGESYGGIRGSLLAEYLQNKINIQVAGLILISPALSETTFFRGQSDINVPYWTFFPSFAATAWYHQKIAPQLQSLSVEEVFDRAKSFAANELRDALDLGSQLNAQDRERIAQQISDFTGIAKERVLELDLRVTDDQIFEELMRKERRVVGRFDSRFTAPMLDKVTDPSADLPAFPYAAGINDYLRRELNLQSASPYNISGRVSPWRDEPRVQWDSMSSIAKALSVNPEMKVFIASGYFDLACPLEGVAYAIRQMPGGSWLGPRVEHKSYVGGHMMYINPPALAQLKKDIASFVTAQTANVK